MVYAALPKQTLALAMRIAEATGIISFDGRRWGIFRDQGLAAVRTRLIDDLVMVDLRRSSTWQSDPGRSGLGVVDLQNDILLSQWSGDIANCIGD